MKQPYIGNTKINKLYKGSEFWCNWVKSGSDTPSTFDTIIFCQKNNNINLIGNWLESSYLCFSNTKSLYTNDNTATITSNLLTLPVGSYKWSMYYHSGAVCNLAFSVEGDYSSEVIIHSNELTKLDFNTIMTFNLTSTSNITLKLSAKNARGQNFCRFFDWKLEKIS